MRVMFSAIAALLLFCTTASAAELKVLSGNGPKAAVRTLCAQFERTTGHKVDLHFSVNADVIKKAQNGESFDVVVGNPPTIDRLIKSHKVAAGSRTDFGRAGLGVAVRAGAPKPDISTVEAFKVALLMSKSIAYPGKGASGIYFVSLLDRLDLKQMLQARLKPMAAEDVVEVVARGEADMVVVVSSRIYDVPGVDPIGPIPDALQTKIGFSAGLSASTQQGDAAKALIRFLAAPESKPVLKAKGVEPL